MTSAGVRSGMRGLMAVLALVSMTASWPGLLRSHCAEHAGPDNTMTMAHHDMSPASGVPASSFAVQRSHDQCTHCPPSDCATTAPCTNAAPLALPAQRADWSLAGSRPFQLARIPASMHSADPVGLTPPPERIL